jgi:hypothetical protein
MGAEESASRVGQVLEDLDKKLDGGEDPCVGLGVVAVGSAIDDGVSASFERAPHEPWQSRQPGVRRHRRRSSYTYQLSKYEVTNAQFAQFIADGGYISSSFWTTNENELEDGIAYRNASIVVRFGGRYTMAEYAAVAESLDLTRPDDRIIADLLLFNRASAAPATLLTHDTNMMLSARHSGAAVSMSVSMLHSRTPTWLS